MPRTVGFPEPTVLSRTNPIGRKPRLEGSRLQDLPPRESSSHSQRPALDPARRSSCLSPVRRAGRGSAPLRAEAKRSSATGSVASYRDTRSSGRDRASSAGTWKVKRREDRGIRRLAAGGETAGESAKPELAIGLAAAVGTPLDLVESAPRTSPTMALAPTTTARVEMPPLLSHPSVRSIAACAGEDWTSARTIPGRWRALRAPRCFECGQNEAGARLRSLRRSPERRPLGGAC